MGDADDARDARAEDANDASGAQAGCQADDDLGSVTGIDVVVGTTVGESDDLTPECAAPLGPAPDLVYRWQAPASGRWLFDTLGSNFDTALHVRDLDCRLLVCSDDATAQLLSRAAVLLEAGQEVYVVVDGAGSRAGEFRLSIHETGPTETECADGIDNDRDGYVDCLDQADCLDVGPCLETDCFDGVDNDGDQAIDCADSNCAAIEPCGESVCDDGLDGDGDFVTDCADSDCQNHEPCTEVVCDDGIDGDMNGTTDCDDAACTCALPCLPPDPCPETDLGSALGPVVASGETGGCPRRTPLAATCTDTPNQGVGTGPETTFRWTAPRAGTYSIDTSGSSFDTTLYLLESCDGATLACNEDIISGVLQRSRVIRDFAENESVIVVIDGWGGQSGSFTLHILEVE